MAWFAFVRCLLEHAWNPKQNLRLPAVSRAKLHAIAANPQIKSTMTEPKEARLERRRRPWPDRVGWLGWSSSRWRYGHILAKVDCCCFSPVVAVGSHSEDMPLLLQGTNLFWGNFSIIGIREFPILASERSQLRLVGTAPQKKTRLIASCSAGAAFVWRP